MRKVLNQPGRVEIGHLRSGRLAPSGLSSGIQARRTNSCARRGIKVPLRGMSFWELLPPMGLCERPTNHPKNQGPTRPGPVRRPRRRKCLLKGCEKNFHPQQAAERYCSEECRQKTREWPKWGVQQRYRASEKSTEKRRRRNAGATGNAFGTGKNRPAEQGMRPRG
jgi:hypothetical protein